MRLISFASSRRRASWNGVQPFRLALFYKWGNEPVELIKFFRGEIDAAAGGRTEFQRGIMGMFGATEKEIMGTTAQLRTSVTDIRRFF